MYENPRLSGQYMYFQYLRPENVILDKNGSLSSSAKQLALDVMQCKEYHNKFQMIFFSKIEISLCEIKDPFPLFNNNKEELEYNGIYQNILLKI